MKSQPPVAVSSQISTVGLPFIPNGMLIGRKPVLGIVVAGSAPNCSAITLGRLEGTCEIGIDTGAADDNGAAAADGFRRLVADDGPAMSASDSELESPEEELSLSSELETCLAVAVSIAIAEKPGVGRTVGCTSWMVSGFGDDGGGGVKSYKNKSHTL
jgi:hypothetical protein